MALMKYKYRTNPEDEPVAPGYHREILGRYPHRLLYATVHFLQVRLVFSNLAKLGGEVKDDTVGRLVPPEGRDTIPSGVTFVVREVDKEGQIQWEVRVLKHGEFDLVLPEGGYEFSITVEEYSFTLAGQVTITEDAEPDATMILYAPWC